MHLISAARARTGVTSLTAALTMFGLVSSPLGSHLVPRASAQTLAVSTAAPYPHKELDSVLIDEVGYKLGGDGFTNGSPAEPATLTWTHNWFGVVPELTGKFHFDGAERCARVKLISYDAAGVQVRDPDYSDTECPGDLGHNAREITEGGSSGVQGQPGAAEIKVILQTQNADLSWSNAGSQTVTYGPVLDTDPVQIFRDGADLGEGPFHAPNPDAAATVTWNSTGGPINPVLRGTLYIKNSADLCFRTRATYKKHDGVQLEPPRTGTEHCVEDDELHQYPVLMNAFFHNEVAEITYAIEKKGGTGVWETLGQTTVELGDALVVNTNPNPALP
ncbi:MAG TPA: hypothetical protein VGJ60_12510 [Chloroflexota bacterium]|jgi:hypothetical protein